MRGKHFRSSQRDSIRRAAKWDGFWGGELVLGQKVRGESANAGGEAPKKRGPSVPAPFFEEKRIKINRWGGAKDTDPGVGGIRRLAVGWDAADVYILGTRGRHGKDGWARKSSSTLGVPRSPYCRPRNQGHLTEAVRTGSDPVRWGRTSHEGRTPSKRSEKKSPVGERTNPVGFSSREHCGHPPKTSGKKKKKRA